MDSIEGGTAFVVEKDDIVIGTVTVLLEPEDWDRRIWQDERLDDSIFIHRLAVTLRKWRMNMANHMTSIGFPVHSREDFEQIADVAIEKGTLLEAQQGQYIYFDAGNGIELWLQVNQENEIIGLNPHFAGNSRVEIGLTALIVRETDSVLDGACHAWMEPDESLESGCCPLVFDMPNLGLFGEVAVPQRINIQLTAFSHEVSVYDSEEEYMESQEGEVKFAAESFIPSGLFGNSGEPASTAMFTGRVVEASLIQNEYTGGSFSWCKVKTLGGEIDVVTDLELLDKDIAAGSIISGSFWLSAKFVDEPKERLADESRSSAISII
ncbi:hypothetical protein PMJ6TS7_42010 [Paenibacillus melissococcoides]